VAIAGLLLALATTAVASPAFAHDELVASDPAADSTVAELPAELTLTFSGVLIDEAGVNAVSATDAAGTELADGTPQLDGTQVTQPLSGDSQGTITVRWRVVSSDGHPVSGEYSFVAGDPDQAPSAPSDDAAGTTTDEGLPPVFWVVVSVAAVGGVAALTTALVAASRRRGED
jgi:methionine-rich copper-binding protein CopC